MARWLGRHQRIAALAEPSTSEPVRVSNAGTAGRPLRRGRAHASSRPAGSVRSAEGRKERRERTMSIYQHSAPTGGSTKDDGASVIDQLEALAETYGNRFLLEPSPDNQLPEHGMRAVDA